MRFAVFHFSLVIILASCRGPDCIDPGVEVNVGAFDSAEVSVIIVEAYEKGSNYGRKSHTFVTGTSIKSPNPDSTLLLSPANFSLNTKFDYKINLIQIGRTFTVRDFSFEQEHDRWELGGSSEKCSNTIHYYLDDKPHADRSAPFWKSVYPVIIRMVK